MSRSIGSLQKTNFAVGKTIVAWCNWGQIFQCKVSRRTCLLWRAEIWKITWNVYIKKNWTTYQTLERALWRWREISQRIQVAPWSPICCSEILSSTTTSLRKQSKLKKCPQRGIWRPNYKTTEFAYLNTNIHIIKKYHMLLLLLSNEIETVFSAFKNVFHCSGLDDLANSWNKIRKLDFLFAMKCEQR